MTTVTLNHGVTLTSPAYLNPVVINPGFAISDPGRGIYANTTIWTIQNAGSVSGNTAGIALYTGGGITNQSAGGISGFRAVVGGLLSGTTTVDNAGTIAGTVAAGSSGTTHGAGVALFAGGSVNNRLSAAITGYLGINGYNDALSVLNDGDIAGNTATGAGVLLSAGGGLVNQGAGSISGGTGIYGTGGALTVVNTGTIVGSGINGVGIHLKAGGSVTNQSGATISGAADAVTFAAGFANLLEDDPGSVFIGTVDGGNTLGSGMVSTLELGSGSSQGIISGIGSEYQNFARIALDPGASWDVNGPIAAGTTIAFGAGATLALSSARSMAGTITGFAIGDSIAIAGINDAIFANLGANNLLTIGEIGGGTLTLQFDPSQSFAGATFQEIAGPFATVVSLTSPPSVSVGAGLVVSIGGTGTITSGNLFATEVDGAPSLLTYAVTSAPSNGTLLKNGAPVSTFTQADVDDGLITYQDNGSPETSDSFAFRLTDPNRNTLTGSVPITIGAIPSSLVDAYYEGALRVPAATSIVQSDTGLLNGGPLTTTQLLSQLLSQAQDTSVPALLSYDFIFGLAPAASGLTFLTTYAADLQSGNYSFTGGFQLGTTPGEFDLPQFSVMNTYVNFCATDTQIFGNSFAVSYQSYAATPSVADRTLFFTQIYQEIFGIAPAPSTTALFVTSPAAADPTISTFQYYVNYAGSELGGYGAIAGVLLSTAATSKLGNYPGAVNAFLTASAVSGAAGSDTAPYGVSLLASFPSTGSPVGIGSAMVATAADDATITVTTQGQLIDPGSGSHTIQFLTGASGDTLVLHADGTDQVSGFDPATDVLDLRALLSGANLDFNGDVASLGRYVTVTDQGSDALVGFDPSGQGGGGTIVVLHGLANTVTGLNSLIGPGAIRTA